MMRKVNEFFVKLYHKLHTIIRNSALAYNVLFCLIMMPIWVLCYLSGEETRKRIDGKPLWFKAINCVLLLFESACLGYAGGKFFEETFQNDNNNDKSSRYELTDDEIKAMDGINLFD